MSALRLRRRSIPGPSAWSGSVLVIPPLPRTDRGTNDIVITESNDTASPASNILVVSVNGQIDTTQPLASSITRIVAYGAKANDNIFVEPAGRPSIAVTLDGGHGLGKNVLTAGAGPTRGTASSARTR